MLLLLFNPYEVKRSFIAQWVEHQKAVCRTRSYEPLPEASQVENEVIDGLPKEVIFPSKEVIFPSKEVIFPSKEIIAHPKKVIALQKTPRMSFYFKKKEIIDRPNVPPKKVIAPQKEIITSSDASTLSLSNLEIECKEYTTFPLRRV